MYHPWLIQGLLLAAQNRVDAYDLVMPRETRFFSKICPTNLRRQTFGIAHQRWSYAHVIVWSYIMDKLSYDHVCIWSYAPTIMMICSYDSLIVWALWSYDAMSISWYSRAASVCDLAWDADRHANNLNPHAYELKPKSVKSKSFCVAHRTMRGFIPCRHHGVVMRVQNPRNDNPPQRCMDSLWDIFCSSWPTTMLYLKKFF